MGTEFKNVSNCDHKSSFYWRRNYCDAGNKCYILCKIFPKHLPALEYFRKNHKPELGFKNFLTMKELFSPEAYQACSRALSVSLCESTLPEADDELPNSDLISDSTDILQIWPAYSRKTSI